MNTCERHNRYNCLDTQCRTENAGQLSIDTSGGLAMGIGGGLAIDLSTGSLGMQFGGVTIDF